MNIVVDENVPYGLEAFGTLGKVEQQVGRSMTPDSIREADLLIVRSVTQVNEGLLKGSQVQFVGTCTIGMDHIDLDYLRANGIAFASAPGSNANSVAEYVTAALLVLGRRGGFRVEGKTIGVVGVGNVGTQVVKKARALGLRVLQNDPPRYRQTGDPQFLPIDDLFASDILTLHVPLTGEGRDVTVHLADELFFSKMKQGGLFLNTSRGPVADGRALSRAIDGGPLSATLLDVWEGEPEIDIELLKKVSLGTPHIAGYSFDGKVAGTVMVHRAACRHLGVDSDWDPKPFLPAPAHPVLEINACGRDDEDVLREAVLTVYNIEQDDADLRKLIDTAPAKRGAFFDSLRKNYPQRREFHNTTIALKDAGDKIARKLSCLGFEVERA